MEPGKKLASSEQLKGKKSGTGSAGTGKRRIPLPLLLTLAALALAALVYWFSGRVSRSVPQQTPAVTAAAQQETVQLIDRTRDQVEAVTCTVAGETYTVVNGKSGANGPDALYTLKDQPGFELDQNKAEAIIGYAAGLTANRLVADNAENLSVYGLESPKAVVTMRYRDGTETTWLVGDRAPTSTASYFMQQGTQTVYLLYASAAESFTTARKALHTLSLPGTLDAALIRDLVIEAAGKDTVEIGYSEEGEADKGYSISALRIRQPFYYTANAERVHELFSGVAALSISAYAGELGELSGTGLSEEESCWRLTVRQARSSEGLSDLETFSFRIGSRTEDGQWVYLMVDDTQAVYLTPASAAAFLEDATPAYLVDQFANLIYIQAVNGIEIEAGEERWHLEIEHPEEEKASDIFRFNGEQVQNASAFRKLYQQIIGMTSSKISEDYAMDGEVALSVRYQLGVEPGELLVEYLVFDDDYCAVRRDGLTLFLIKRQQVDALLDALRRFDPAAS